MDEAFPVDPPSDQESGEEQGSGSEGRSESSFDGGSDTPGIDYMEIAAHKAPVAQYNNQCGNNCTTNQDCTAGGAKGCLCSTQSEQYQPGKGMVMFVAACVVSLGGKRDGGRPCPCNGTYVSYGCCGVEDGMVWEGAEFKLGELGELQAGGGDVGGETKVGAPAAKVAAQQLVPIGPG